MEKETYQFGTTIILPSAKTTVDNGDIVLCHRTPDGIHDSILGTLNIFNNNFLSQKEILQYYTPRHIYLVDFGDILEGDYYIVDNTVKRADYNLTNEFSLAPYCKFCKKIVRTTDESLGLPLISLPFIIGYIETTNNSTKYNKSQKLKVNKTYTNKELITLLDKFGRHVSKQILGHELDMIGELAKWLPKNT